MPNKNIEQLLEVLDNVKPEDVPELLSLLKKQQESEQPKSYSEDDVKELQTSYESFLQIYDFKNGQFVKWKKGLKLGSK